MLKSRRIVRHAKQPAAHPPAVAAQLRGAFSPQTVPGRVLQTPITDGSYTDPDPDNDGNAGYGLMGE